MKRLSPGLKKNWGYFLSSDYAMPDSVSLAMFKEFARLVKEL